MGSLWSSPESKFTQDLEMEERIKMVFHFSDTEIKNMIRTFKKLDKDGTGTVSNVELFGLPQFKTNPFKDRILAVSDKDLSSQLDIKEFAELYSVFSVRATREQKLRFAFKIYDHDGDGKLSRQDIENTLKTIVQSNLTDEELKQVVDQVMEEGCMPGSADMSFEDFSKVVMNTDIEGKLTFDF